MDILIGILAIAAIFLLIYFGGYKRELKDYNNGICPHCGEKLEHRPILDDRQGGKGFKCKKCEYTIWVSWFRT